MKSIKIHRYYFFLLFVFFQITLQQLNAQPLEDTVDIENSSQIEEREINTAEWKKITKGINYDEREEIAKAPMDFNFPRINGTVAKIVFFSLVIALLIYILFKLFANNKVRNDSISTTTEFNIDNLDENFNDIDLNSLLKDALEKQSYKLAIRIYYLIILQQLSKKELIIWKKDKTNSEYIRELSHSHYYTEFKQTTLAFEKVWYGNSEIKEHDYQIISPAFKNVIDQLNTNGEA